MATADSSNPSPGGGRLARAAGVIVVSSVMFTFISYWRTAAVVLCDMSSTVYYIGAIVETAPKAQIYSDPQHPYSRALLDAVPRADPDFVRHPVVVGRQPPARA